MNKNALKVSSVLDYLSKMRIGDRPARTKWPTKVGFDELKSITHLSKVTQYEGLNDPRSRLALSAKVVAAAVITFQCSFAATANHNSQNAGQGRLQPLPTQGWMLSTPQRQELEFRKHGERPKYQTHFSIKRKGLTQQEENRLWRTATNQLNTE